MRFAEARNRFGVVRFRRSARVGTLVFVAVILLAIGGVAASGQTGSGFDLTWHRISCGGDSLQGAGYTLSTTIGQPEAGVLAGGGYTLVGGFWGGAVSVHRVYLPLMLRQSS